MTAMAEIELSEEVARNSAMDATATAVKRSTRPSSCEADLILDVLTLCADTFATSRARFIRELPGGEWQVYSMKGDSLFTHMADYAEIGMAWAVGLSRFPMRVTRPRITAPDGSAVRPIAVTSYFGIPILCADHFVGVIELAGNISNDLERTLERLRATLQNFGTMLTHDPSLRLPQLIDMECECWLDGGSWTRPRIELDSDEWVLVAALREPTLLRALVEDMPFTEERLVEMVRSLVGRGMLSVRASTRSLAENSERPRS